MNTQFLNLQSYPTFGSLAADMTRSHAHQIDLADRDRAAGGCYAPASHPPFIRHLLRFPVSSETQLDVALQAKRQLRKHELATRVGISIVDPIALVRDIQKVEVRCPTFRFV